MTHRLIRERLVDGEMPRGSEIACGTNYSQGSCREHAAWAPRDLGLRVVLAKSFARISR